MRQIKSETVLFGLPLYHIVIGRDESGQKPMAAGIFAFGRRAVGVIAIGQFAVGIITFAQFGIGIVFGVGQFLAGGVLLAQFALGLVAAIGQFATGWWSMGQLSVGYSGLAQAGWHYHEENWTGDFFQRLGDALSRLAGRMEALTGLGLSALIPILIVTFVVGLISLVFGPLIYRSIRGFLDEAMVSAGLLKSVPAMARVESVEQTSLYVNNLPVVKMRLTVRPPDRAPFETDLKIPVSMISSQQPEPGSTIQVLCVGRGKRIILP